MQLARSRGQGSGGITAATELGALWQIRLAASPTIAGAAAHRVRSLQFLEDAVVPVRALASYLGGVEDILARQGTDGVVFGHAGDAPARQSRGGPATHELRDQVRSMLEDAVDLVVDLGGTLAGEHGEGRLRAPSLERAWGPAWTRAFRTTEDLPDPNGLSNPAPYPAGARG